MTNINGRDVIVYGSIEYVKNEDIFVFIVSNNKYLKRDKLKVESEAGRTLANVRR